MFNGAIKQSARVIQRKFYSSKSNGFKVCVVGGAGGIGQPLSLLFKINELVSTLTLFDTMKHTPGIATDLSHIQTESVCKGYFGAENRERAFACADLVMCAAGLARKPGMTRDDLFNKNACIVKDVMEACVEHCPNAIIAVITNPLNMVVPLCAEILKLNKCYDPNKLIGVSNLDTVRACTFIGNFNKCDPRLVRVPVIGGHSNTTMVPVISKSEPQFKGDKEQVKKLMNRIREAGTEVVLAKDGAGSATLSMAYAGHRLGNSILRGLNGEKNVVECAYVESKLTDAPFFSSPLIFGKHGIKENLGLPEMNDLEKDMLKKAIPIIKQNCQKGIDFVKKK